MMKVISLKTSIARRIAFEEANGHLDFEIFPAVDGRRLPDSVVRDPGLFEPGLDYSPGAMGAALSHLSLWETAAAGDAAVTIAEDDAVFRHDFEIRSAEALGRLSPDWDIVLWGWNFDSILAVDVLGSVSPVVCAFDQDRMRQSIPAFQAQTSETSLLRLGMCFGLPAYSVSPGGARKLIARCFPLRRLSVDVPVLGFSIPNKGVDIAMSACYPSLNAFAAFPPLVVTKNEHEISTIQA